MRCSLGPSWLLRSGHHLFLVPPHVHVLRLLVVLASVFGGSYALTDAAGADEAEAAAATKPRKDARMFGEASTSSRGGSAAFGEPCCCCRCRCCCLCHWLYIAVLASQARTNDSPPYCCSKRSLRFVWCLLSAASNSPVRSFVRSLPAL